MFGCCCCWKSIQKARADDTTNAKELLTPAPCGYYLLVSLPAGAVPDDLPVVEVSESTLGVSVKWGDEGIMQPTTKPHSTYFVASKANGNEPTFKEFGALLHCDGGTLTIGKRTYRILQQQANGKKCFRFGSFVRSFVVAFIQIVLG